MNDSYFAVQAVSLILGGLCPIFQRKPHLFKHIQCCMILATACHWTRSVVLTGSNRAGAAWWLGQPFCFGKSGQLLLLWWSVVMTTELRNHSRKWMTPFVITQLCILSSMKGACIPSWGLTPCPSGESLSLIPISWVLDFVFLTHPRFVSQLRGSDCT